MMKTKVKDIIKIGGGIAGTIECPKCGAKIGYISGIPNPTGPAKAFCPNCKEAILATINVVQTTEVDQTTEAYSLWPARIGCILIVLVFIGIIGITYYLI